MEKPDLSIIIVSFNTKQITHDCIVSIQKSLTGSEIVYEIVVVDNASDDGSVGMLKGLQSAIKNLKLVQSKTNLGFGKGNNLGVKKARADLILLLNSDIIVLDNAVEKLLSYYKSQVKFQFLGGKLLNKDLSEQPSCGPFYTLPIIFAALFLKGDHWNLTRYSPNSEKEVDWVSGACILTKKEYFQKVGGFDEKIFMYMEEVDMLHRAKRFNFSTGFYPDAKFIHLGSASSGGKTYPILQVYTGFLFLYSKHRSKTALILLKFMLQLKAAVAWSIGKITNNDYLVRTYEKAYKIASMD